MTPLDDISVLRSIRGRFRNSLVERWFSRALALFFFVILSSLFIYALFHSGIPHPPFSADQWTCIVLPFISFFLAVILWRTADVEYEFTGDEIICRRAGSVRWRLSIDSITDVRVEVLPRSRSMAWHLRSGSVRRRILVVESLAEYVSRTAQA